jgi:hypothetical protein
VIVYRDRKRSIATAELLATLERSAGVDLLIEAGELEAALADTLCPERDRDLPELRNATMAAARGGPIAVDALRSLRLPRTLEAPVSEGYAWYAVDPELYRRAALAYFCEVRPERVAVVGIRSIGTSLSAVAAVALESEGCAVRTWTVRPRGHPFDRRLQLSEEMEAQWRECSLWHWAVVDEGPGLSGSSFAGVTLYLSQLGVPPARIALFPSWNPDGSQFLSEVARAEWQRYRRFSTAFEEMGCFQADHDWSAGRWREFVCNGGTWPAAQPQHERRKYLRRCGSDAHLYKFAGYGRYGKERLERARHLAADGLTPPVEGIEHGFLITRFLRGTPATPGPDLFDAVAAYLAHVRRSFPAAEAAPLTDMIRVNVEEALGERSLDLTDRTACIVWQDGRILPHEWIESSGRIYKTDAADHADDHFFPGPQDIAWDVAAAEIEFGTGSVAQRYARLSGDHDIHRRLPFFRLAYLSFRTGYTCMAAQSLAGTSDGTRFARLREWYRGLLAREVVEWNHG